jgi:hypothetical protein
VRELAKLDANVTATLTAAAFGLLPALRAARGATTARLTASRHSLRAQSALVACEVALALVLVASSTLLLASFRRLLAVDPGFDPQGLVLVDVHAPGDANDFDGQKAFYRSLLDRATAIPGVERGGLSYQVPGGVAGTVARVFVEGVQPE